jgi:tetratricopeptide (TPR) repeat protein
MAASQLALVLAAQGDAQRGLALDEEAAETLRSLEDSGRLRSVLINMAEVQFSAGDTEGALRTVEEALELGLNAGGVEHSVMVCHLNAAGYLLALGRTTEAFDHARTGLEISVRIKRALITAIAAGHLGQIAATHGDYERAARLIGFADNAYSAHGIVREPTELKGYNAAMAAIAVSLSQERRAALLAEGAKLSQDAAVKLAMEFSLPTAAA